MPTLTTQVEAAPAWQLPPVQPLNMLMWQAWEARGRDDDRRIAAAQINAVRWISISALLATAVIWSRLAPYEVVARFVVSIGAVVAMMSALRSRNYTLGIIFFALVLLFNPVIPFLQFSGNWPRALVVLCMAPFGALLPRGRSRVATNA